MNQLPPPVLRVLVCGAADRGDDGAAVVAVARVLARLDLKARNGLEVRRCPQLDVGDVLDVAPGESCLLLDTVVGPDPGIVVTRPLESLLRRDAGLTPRSSHALPIDQVLGIVDAIRGELPRGTFVGIAGHWFGFGSTRSRAVQAALPAFEAAIDDAIEALLATRPTALVVAPAHAVVPAPIG